MGNNLFGLFGRSIVGLDCPGREKCARGCNLCGTCYRVFGKGYHGRLWVCDGGSFSVTRFNVSFTEDCTIRADLPGCVLITCPAQEPGAENRKCRILCCCENGEVEQGRKAAFAKGSRIAGTEIVLTEHFGRQHSVSGNCRRCLCGAFANAENLRGQSALVRIFDQLDSCDFPVRAARMFCESKALEALAVLSAECEAPLFEEKTSPDLNIDDNFTARVKQYIDENSHSEITIESLAKIACMSPSKLKYTFSRALGKSIFAYLTETRMEKAKTLLADTQMTIEGVAAEVGYKKSGAFAATFRRHTGMLPKEYRSAERALLISQSTLNTRATDTVGYIFKPQVS
ncbi:MAG: AraC family transcriptional regulator [Oscillospiraceae bacterium]|jgi:AraC-like DNA-binding protein|nr:AraC family transcriptional regulator [Oscillospiraceae bacterium]